VTPTIQKENDMNIVLSGFDPNNTNHQDLVLTLQLETGFNLVPIALNTKETSLRPCKNQLRLYPADKIIKGLEAIAAELHGRAQPFSVIELGETPLSHWSKNHIPTVYVVPFEKAVSIIEKTTPIVIVDTPSDKYFTEDVMLGLSTLETMINNHQGGIHDYRGGL